MIGLTLCSGIGAPEMAAPWVDWRFASEIEAFPRSVLQQRFGYRVPEDHNQGDPLLWGDMTEVTPDLLRQRGIPLPDLIVAGTPCQAFSVAGARKGLEDPRGNLTLAFVEICHAIVAARPDGKLAVLWENVPGVLSDSGNAFGAFLGGLVGALDALPQPAGGSWPGEGMVQGPRARAAWAALDAQWFGVAQRRRRVFVVVDFGNCCDPAQILLEPDSLRGDSPPRRETWQGVAASLTRSLGRRGGLPSGGEIENHLIPSTGSVAHCLNAGGMGRIDYETERMVAHALRGEGFDASEDGTGRGTPIVPVAFHNRQEPDVSGAVTHPLGAKDNGMAVAFDMRGRDGGAMPEGPHDTANIRAASGGSSRSYVATPWAVRRLTPRECARLQGFPDDHSEVEHRGKPAADGPQYKAYGNSMAVPCIRWILDRLKISWEAAA
ncbi:DNA cytosine methyltransferase [Vannielia litorea]|uniref:DNA cytosine methyltransferase n=1 Tax=Vannielia litorea TaxID=1217970 RepID=UPI001BCE2268|nr:DNA cytosine methyltransferase [Vannielia litorea]